MPDLRASLSLALLVVALATGSLACGNVCEKAAAKLDDCLIQFCAHEVDNPMCAPVSEDAVAGSVGTCNEAAQAQAERVMSLDCDALFAGQAIVGGTGSGTGAAN